MAGKLSLGSVLPAGAAPDLVSRITNGLGGNWSIRYQPITDSAVYRHSGPGLSPTGMLNAGTPPKWNDPDVFEALTRMERGANNVAMWAKIERPLTVIERLSDKAAGKVAGAVGKIGFHYGPQWSDW